MERDAGVKIEETEEVMETMTDRQRDIRVLDICMAMREDRKSQ